MKRITTTAKATLTPMVRQYQNRSSTAICFVVVILSFSPHPYLFFNQDHISMTFLGFYINSAGDLVDPQRGIILERGLMSKQLHNGLQAQGVDFATNTENLKKEKKIAQLCSVMGVHWVHDPDRAYELTTDNVKKILAIHMRFRCNIPVIVMGETGCGKTRLIRYMCGLQAGPNGPRNMLLVKVSMNFLNNEDLARFLAEPC
ncbi:E3 ubiquitin-protein ligase RNF213-like [Oculina patagonica]